MMANGQHEDLIRFVSEAWTRMVVDSRGEAPIFYKCNVPEQNATSNAGQRNSYSNSITSANNSNSSGPPPSAANKNSSSSSSTGSNPIY